MYELINKQFIEVKEYKGQRVVTFKDIDTLHQRPAGTAKRNFNEHKQYFIDGVDFFIVKPADIQKYEIRTSEINNRGTILLTESGYLMIVKSFTDELAWKVQRQLVNTYFRARQQNNYSCIDQSAIIMIIKQLCEKNCELNYKIEKLNTEINRLNHEQNRKNLEFTVIIKMICERIFKKQSRKSKSKKYKFM